ncbi:MAG: hypothetical protein RJA70_844 [Pseudomonadota bacterium]|jgi:hypothetical protein
MIRDRLKTARDLIKRRVREKLKDLSEQTSAALVAPSNKRSELDAAAPEPPVVARLMIEIRSDGTRTVARGALKDELSGEQVTLEAKGTTPMQLAAQLAKSLMTTPLAAAQLARSLRRSRQLSDAAEPEDERS